MMREERLENVKKEIRSVIIAYQSNVRLDVFCKAYKQLVGVRLPTREFGYISDIDFLHSLPDIVRIQTDQNGDYLLNCIVDEKIEHIHNFVVRQKKPKPKSKTVSYRNFNEQAINTSTTKPFVSASLRKKLFQVLKDFPEGLSYQPLLVAYRKKFKRPLNLDFLSENNHGRLEKLASTVSELKVKVVDDTERLFYCPLIKSKSRQETISSLDKANVLNECFAQNEIKDLEISALPKIVKNDFEKVLKLYPNGVLARHFPILYERVSGERFDIGDLGYTSLIELADSFPEIFIPVNCYDKPNDWMLFHPSFSENAARLKDKNKMLKIADEKLKKSTKLDKEEIPSDIALPTNPYLHPQFPSDANLSIYIPVFISAIVSPSCFWFKLQFEDIICRFRELEEEMQCFYHSCSADTYKMLNKDIAVGATCAALFEDHWYRATITSSPRVELITVYLVDYGSWERVHYSKLRYLKSAFIHLPSQAFKAKLALVKPAKGSKTWTVRAEARFSNLCDKSCIMARIYLEYEDMVSVFLCDTSGDEDIHINDVLVNDNLAESYPSDEFPLNTQNSQISDVHKASGEESCTNASCFKENSKNELSQRISMDDKGTSEKNSECVRRIHLGEGYSVHIVSVGEKNYVCASDLCSLFWQDKSPEVLKARLELKNVEVSFMNISKQEHKQLFKQCEKIAVRGFQNTSSHYSVVLYSLTDVMKILNCFGHPSVHVRESIKILLKNFNSVRENFIKSGDQSETLFPEKSTSLEDDINKKCLYDLKAFYEAVKFKRMMLQRSHDETNNSSILNDLRKVEALTEIIEKRIEYINSICSSYSNCE